MLEISKIKEGYQVRKTINESTVQEYADHLIAGGSLPPIVVFFDTKDYWLADGWHRLKAHQRIDCLTIHEEVHIGTKRDALKYALSANSKHGLPRTNADKRNAVEIALSDKEWASFSNKEIARLCGVSNTFVAMIKDGGGKRLPPEDKIQAVKSSVHGGQNENKPLIEKEENTLSTEDIAEKSEYTELDEAKDQVEELQNIVAAGFMATTDEDRASGLKLLADLRHEVKTLRATLSATESQRDALMTENASIKRQCLAQARKLKKYEDGGNVR